MPPPKSSGDFFRLNLVVPLFNLRFGVHDVFKISRIYKHLQSTHTSTREEIETRQLDKLKSLVAHVYKNVPFYRDFMKRNHLQPGDFTNLESIKFLPVITKDMIRESTDRFTSVNSRQIKHVRVRTGGTSGTPLSCLRDLSSLLWSDGYIYYGMEKAGYRYPYKIVYLKNSGSTPLSGRVRLRLTQSMSIVVPDENGRLKISMDRMAKIKPKALSGYPTTLKLFADCLREYGIHLDVPVTFSTGEMLYDQDRHYIESSLRTEIFDYYGCNEVGSIAFECKHHRMHVSEEHVILEQLNDTLLKDQKHYGDLAVTDLDNRTMPFIRYVIGDKGALDPTPCPCGYPAGTIGNLYGRTHEFLYTGDGGRYPGIFFPIHFGKLKGIDQYQMIQNPDKSITFHYVPNSHFTDSELHTVMDFITGALGVTVDLKRESSIEITGRGKTRLIISNVPDTGNHPGAKE